MKVDEIGEFQMARYKGRTVKSDHNMLKLIIDLEFHKERKHDEMDVFNVRNKLNQERFCEFTSKDTRFSVCFSSKNEIIDIQFNRWRRLFNKAIHACFNKIKVKGKRVKEASQLDTLINEKRDILKKKKITQDDLERVKSIEKEISHECEDKEFEKLERVVNEIESNKTNIWKELRKAYPNKTKPIPTGVRDIKGRVITNPEERKQVTLDHFHHRMRKRPVNDDVREIVKLQDELFKERLTKAKENKSPPFTMKELEKVMTSLKKGMSKDPEGLICELFKDGVIGKDLKMSVLLMMNRIKETFKIPVSGISKYNYYTQKEVQVRLKKLAWNICVKCAAYHFNEVSTWEDI